MDKSLKAELLDLLAGKDLRVATDRLLDFLPADHPSTDRARQLEKRFSELEGRIDMGTLSPEDIDRVQSRIAGGLREIVLDYKPYIAPAAAPEKKTAGETFTLNLITEPEAAQPEAPAADMGFRGTVDYAGSPSKKEETIVLPKSYGAAYHAAVQSVRKCGMDMVTGDRAGGKIHASSPGNTMARLGENIYIWVMPVSRASTNVHVIVDSGDPKMVFDMGRHKQKLAALLHQLRNA